MTYSNDVLAGKLNLNLALTRVIEDLKEECFVELPFEIMLINSNRDNWIENLRTKIKDGKYNPSKVRLIDVPKPKYHIRPGTIMTMDDMVVYSALIIDIIDKIDQGMALTSSNKFSYKLKKNKMDKHWFEFPIDHWGRFRTKSIKLIDDGYKYVLFSDISSFFENISISKLMTNLEYLDVPEDTKNLLSKCLNRWSDNKEKGLCQGMSPSQILADVYLNNIDERLINQNIVYLRFVDDYRIFCKTKKDAIEALHFFTKRCRERGLNLQTAKTEIKEEKQAILKINGVSKTISKINKQILAEMSDDLKIQHP